MLSFRRCFSNRAAKFQVSLNNPKTAFQVAEAFVPPGSKDKVIVEAFSGHGVLTRALLELPRERIRKIIVLESGSSFLESLQPLRTIDSRVQVVPLDGYIWGTYGKLEAEGHLRDVEVSSWEKADPSLHFISHLPTSIHGEQFIAQLLRLIPDRGWLFRYGRVPMSYIMHDAVWERISADTSTTEKLRNRCKLSVIAEAVASFREVVPSDSLQPYEDHFWPPILATAEGRSKKRRKNGNMVAVTIDPLAQQIISSGLLDKWDFCLRKLYVLKSHPLKSAISHLAPGASTLLSMLADNTISGYHPIDVNKPVREMGIQDWASLVRAFDSWPFAPEDLLVTDSFNRED